MKVVSDVLLKNLLIVGSIILLIELIISLIYYGLFVIQINKASPQIRTESYTHIEEILNSFNEIVYREFSNAITDLFLIQHHSQWLLSSIIIENDSHYNNYLLNKASSYLIDSADNDFPNDYMATLKDSIAQFNTIESQIEHLILEEEYLNTTIFHSSNSVEYNNIKNSDELKLFYCHLIEIMKSIVIRDIVSLSYNKQFMLLNNDVISAYPPMPFKFKDIKALDYYSNETGCRVDKYESHCFAMLYPNEGRKDYVKVMMPKFKAEGLSTQLCMYIKAPLTAISPSEFILVCTNLIIESQMVSDPILNDLNQILIVSYNDSSDDISVLYSNDNEIQYRDNAFPMSDYHKRFKYNNDSIYSLYHIIYYKLLQNSNLTEEQIEKLEQEYVTSTKELREFLKSNKEVNVTKQFNASFTFLNRQYDAMGHLSYEYGYNINDEYIMVVSPIVPKLLQYNMSNATYDNGNKGSSHSDRLFYSIVISNLKERAFYKEHSSLFLVKELKLGVFYIVLIIVGKYCVFNLFSEVANRILKPIKKYQRGLRRDFNVNVNALANGNGSRQSMTWAGSNTVITVKRTISGSHNDNESNVIITKEKEKDKEKASVNINASQMTDRSQIPLNSLLIPNTAEVNQFIKDKDKEKFIKDKHKDKDNDKLKLKKTYLKENQYPIYTNKDIKELESFILYIRNIYYSKSSDSIENLQNKISTFKHLSNVILSKDSSIIKLDCLYLISFAQYKLKLYDSSLSTLTQLISLINKLNHEGSSNENLMNYYLMITQSNADTKYFNDYSPEFTLAGIDKGIILNIKAQQIYFFYSLITISHYFNELKPTARALIGVATKADSQSKFMPQPNPNVIQGSNAIIPNKEYLLDSAIKYLRCFHKFNSLLKTNQLRIVYSYYLLSKCYFELNKNTEALDNICSALFELYDFNNHFTKEDSIDPRVMLFSNSILIQIILLQLSEILIAINKRNLAGRVLRITIEISPYTTDALQQRAAESLNKLLHGNVPILGKISNRLSIEGSLPKDICILASNALMTKWIAINELKMFCIKILKKYFSEEDRLLYWDYASLRDHGKFKHKGKGKGNRDDKHPLGRFIKIEEINRSNSWVYFFKTYCNDKEVLNSINSDEDNKVFVNCASAITNAVYECVNNDNVKKRDRCIFNFIMGEDINTYNNIPNDLIELMNTKRISLFTLCFNYNKVDQQIKNDLLLLHSRLHEGIVLWVNDFDLIKLPFLSIAVNNGTKNLFRLSSKLFNNIC